jgi:hypothetical protein
MPSLSLEKDTFYFEANNHVFDIEHGMINTTYLPNGGMNWDWTMALSLKKSDAIPMGKKCAILWQDRTVFVYCKVIERKAEGKLTNFRLVPYFENEG